MNKLNVVELPYVETLSELKNIEIRIPMTVHGNVGKKAYENIKGWNNARLFHLTGEALSEGLWVIIKPKYDYDTFITEWFLLTSFSKDYEGVVDSLMLKMSGSRGPAINRVEINKSSGFFGENGFDEIISQFNFIKETYRQYDEATELSHEEKILKADRIALRELKTIKDFINDFKANGVCDYIKVPKSDNLEFNGHVKDNGYYSLFIPSYYYMDIQLLDGKVFVVLHFFKYRKTFDIFDPEAIIEFVKESRVRALTDPRMTNYRGRCDEVVLSRSKDNNGEESISSEGPMTDDEVMKMIGEERK